MDVIYLAYAKHQSAYLPQLRKESETIYQTLRPWADQGGNIFQDEVVSISNMIEFLVKHRRELTIFHFSGTAGRENLLLAEHVALTEGLTNLLAKCPNLRLVFLQGVATKGQLDPFLQLPQGVAVIACNAGIDDRKTGSFVENFYKYLVEFSFSVKEAFEAAVGAANIEVPMSRDMDRPGILSSSFAGLFVAEGREQVLDWKLSTKTSGFENLVRPKSPITRPAKIRDGFKFLDPYDPEDEDIFFGRDREVDELYERSFLSRLLVVYGPSGAGKTSLINCGFQNRLSGTDRMFISIRRGSNLIQSLKDQLGWDFFSAGYDSSPAEGIISLFEDRLIPIFLVFDQLEELFILGDYSEQEDFFKMVWEILETPVPCKVILVLQEAYLAALSDFEKIIPFLFDNRFRLHPMEETQLWEVTNKTIGNPSFQIIFPDHNEITGLILRNLQNGDHPIDLTDLQVYLDRLYNADLKRRENSEDYIFFDRKLIEDIGEIPQPLSVFLDEQLEAIDHQLGRPGVALDFLSTLITGAGTRRTLTWEEIRYFLEERTFDWKDTGELPASLLEHFLDNRLIRNVRYPNDRYELAHNAVAKLLLLRFSMRTENLRKTQRLLENAIQRDLDQQKLNNSRHFLTEQSLALLDLLSPVLSLTDDQQRYQEASQTAVTRMKNEERLRLEAEAREEKQRRLKVEAQIKWAWGLAILATILAAFIGVMVWML